MTKQTKGQVVLHKLEALATATPYAPEAQAARAKAEQLKVHTVVVQVEPASERDLGKVEYGHYVVENGDTLVMTDSEGAPIKHHAIEARVKLLPDQTAGQVARGLVRKMHGTDPYTGFYCRLRYSNAGIV